jgi:hypothetical protein
VESCELLWIKIKQYKKSIFMAEAGYSGTALIKKLGIKPEMKFLILHAPENYFQLLAADLSKQNVAPTEIPGLIHLFARSTDVLKKK